MQIETMRDTSGSADTDWIRNGLYEREAEDLSVAGLGEAIRRLPEIGQEHIREALADSRARPIVLECLRSWNPEACLSKQLEDDLAESVKPTGKVIVFRSLVSGVAPKIQDMEDTLLNALPTRHTEEADIVRKLIMTSDEPEVDIQNFYEYLALQAMAPDEVPDWRQAVEDVAAADESQLGSDQDLDGIYEGVLEGLGFLGAKLKKSFGKKLLRGPSGFMGKKGRKTFRKIRKIAGITVGVAAVAAGLYFAGPAIIGAVGSVGGGLLKGVAGAFSGGAKKKKAGPGGEIITTYEQAPSDAGGQAPGGPIVTTYGPGAAPSAGPEQAAPQYAPPPYGGGGGGAPPPQADYQYAPEAAPGGPGEPRPGKAAQAGVLGGISPEIILAGLAVLLIAGQAGGGGGAGGRRRRRNR